MLAVVLVLHRGRSAAAGIASVGAIALLLTVFLMPGALSDYLHRLPQNVHAIQVEQPYLWDRHVTLKAFWRLLLQGRGAGDAIVVVNALTVGCALPLLLGLPLAAFRSGGMGTARPCPWPPRGHADRGQGCRLPMPPESDAVIAGALASAPLLMPFYFDYDLLLLAAAGALTTTAGRRSVWLWSALYLWLFLNPYLAGVTRVNLTVPLLFTLALWLVNRALHGRPRAEWIEAAGETPHSLAKAA